MLAYRKNRTIATILAFSGTVTISGLHKFYLGQPVWGIVYGLLSWTLIPKIASAIEGFWYLTQDEATFDRSFNQSGDLGAGQLSSHSLLFPHTQSPNLSISIDVNQANLDDWLSLSGISLNQARSLVALSHSGVKFYCIEDVAAALGVSANRLKPWEALLNFSYYDQDSIVEIVELVNPNTASVANLVKVPGIDLSSAEAIVQNRLTFGHFRDLVDFQQRLQLSGAAIAELMHYLRF
jgi:DNA uptake protein ComE-like DNA-binding protein/TM2 domain-containing membrane protein YozV